MATASRLPPQAAATPLNPRKKPTQKRSRNTVESILQATEELVAAHGFRSVGTRMIAERAGVSTGSLYQYFPSYESILLVWRRRVSEDAALRMKQATLDILDRDIASALDHTIGMLLRIFEDNERVLIQLAKIYPELSLAADAGSFEEMNRQVMRLFFIRNYAVSSAEIDGHIFFVSNIVLANIREYIDQKPRFLTRKIFVSRLCAIVRSYLEQQCGVAVTAPSGPRRQRIRRR